MDELVSVETYQDVDHSYLNSPLIDQVLADETDGNGVHWYLSGTQNTVENSEGHPKHRQSKTKTREPKVPRQVPDILLLPY